MVPALTANAAVAVTTFAGRLCGLASTPGHAVELRLKQLLNMHTELISSSMSWFAAAVQFAERKQPRQALLSVALPVQHTALGLQHLITHRWSPGRCLSAVQCVRRVFVQCGVVMMMVGIASGLEG
jgi:hypothetical protein